MGSKVPPMTPKRLGWPTRRIVGAGSAATVEPRTLGLRGAKFGDLNHALRVATTGVMVGPGVFECLAILGKDKTLQRIDVALR